MTHKSHFYSHYLIIFVFQRSPPQEEQLRVDGGDFQGAASAENGEETLVPGLLDADVHYVAEEGQTKEGERGLGRSQGSQTLYEHDDTIVIHVDGDNAIFSYFVTQFGIRFSRMSETFLKIYIFMFLVLF